jgi:hypothetical protein
MAVHPGPWSSNLVRQHLWITDKPVFKEYCQVVSTFLTFVRKAQRKAITCQRPFKKMYLNKNQAMAFVAAKHVRTPHRVPTPSPFLFVLRRQVEII